MFEHLHAFPVWVTAGAAASAVDCRVAAETFEAAIGWQGLGTLGASNLAAVPGEHGLGGLLFVARILPMRKNGGRAARPRRMAVIMSLTPDDLIDVEVRHMDRTVHARIEGIYIYQLRAMCLALDYDGDDAVLNPRYA